MVIPHRSMALTSVSERHRPRLEVSELIDLQWKTFNFFDVSQVKAPDEGDGGSILEVKLICLTLARQLTDLVL